MGVLYNQICTLSVLTQAFNMGLKKNSRCGLDGVTWDKINQTLDTFLVQLRNELKGSRYFPDKPKVESKIFTFDQNKIITFDIVNIKDRIVEYAIKTTLSPLYEKTFLPFSCAYRPEKGEKFFIALMEYKIKKDKCPWIICVDVKNFANSININLLINELQFFIKDNKLTELIKKCLFLHNKKVGIPLGHVLTPFLLNIFLHPIDVQLKDKNVIRYGDNWFFLEKDKSNYKKLVMLVEKLIAKRDLFLNHKKTKIVFNPNPRELLR